jgi:hypothetical protein
MSLEPTEQAALQRAASLLRLTARAISFRTDRLIHEQVQADAAEALAVVRELIEPVLVALEQGGRASITSLVRQHLKACAESIGSRAAQAAVTDLQAAAWFVQGATGWCPERAER